MHAAREQGVELTLRQPHRGQTSNLTYGRLLPQLTDLIGDVVERGGGQRALERLFGRAQGLGDDLEQGSTYRAFALGIGLVHAEDAFVLDRLVDVGKRNARGLTPEDEAAG